MRDTCIAKRGDRTQCKAHPMVSDQYCFFHSPATNAERKAASAAGGRAKKPALPPDAPSIPLRGLPDVSNLNELLLKMLWCGEIGHHTVNSVAYLVGIQLRVLGAEALEERIVNLESFGRPAETVSEPAAAADSTRIPLPNAAALRDVIENLISMLVKDQVDHRTANAAGLTVANQLRVLTAQLEERMAALEASDEGAGLSR